MSYEWPWACYPQSAKHAKNSQVVQRGSAFLTQWSNRHRERGGVGVVNPSGRKRPADCHRLEGRHSGWRRRGHLPRPVRGGKYHARELPTVHTGVDHGTKEWIASACWLDQNAERCAFIKENSVTTLDLIGSSPKFQALLTEVERVARVDSAVLIQGETGTGKEVIARAIHEASPRRNHRFVALNCAAIPSALLESELFGHERGAFTGACAQTKGRFQMADGGTLFLDEIGDMPLELQPKLLRALQEREFERLGSGQTVRVNVRVVAATNQDLGQLVSRKLFRADLFYRLNVIPLYLPPLRERVQDILPLTEFFVEKLSARLNKTINSIPDEVVAVLQAHEWTGNIRELQNFIERAVLFSPGSVLRLPLDLRQTLKQSPESDPRTLADAEREHIRETLEQTNWLIGGQGGAANRLGLPRTTLIYKMRKLGIETRRSLGARPIRQLANEQCHSRRELLRTRGARLNGAAAELAAHRF